MISATHINHHSIVFGKYRIAASPRALPSGRFTAHVAVASGQGSASTARIMSFADDFATHDAAASFALSKGLDWVQSATKATQQDFIN